MICDRCGAQLSEEDDFCSECGAKLETSTHTLKRIQLKCKVCGGEMKIDEEHEMLVCQFCGSKEKLVESDEVIIAEMRKEVEMKRLDNETIKLNNEAEQYKRNEKREDVGEFKKGIFSKLLLVATVVSFFLILLYLGEGSWITSGVALIQTVIFVVSWLMGMGFIKEKQRYYHYLIGLIGFALFILIPIISEVTDEKYYTTYEWSDSAFCTVIPKPESEYGTVNESISSLEARIYRTTEKQFTSYVAECKQKGFNIDIKGSGMSFGAFNEEGYKLTVNFYEDEKELYIFLVEPKIFGEIKWPEKGLGALLPIPDSLMGYNMHVNDERFSVYLGNMTKQQFSDYVNECIDAGFDVDYSRGDNYFYGYNKDGNYLSVDYEGYNTIEVWLSKEL